MSKRSIRAISIITCVIMIVFLCFSVIPIKVNRVAEAKTYLSSTNSNYAAHVGEELTIQYRGRSSGSYSVKFIEKEGKMIYSTTKLTYTYDQNITALSSGQVIFNYTSSSEGYEFVYSDNLVEYTFTPSAVGTYYVYLLLKVLSPSGSTIYYYGCFATITVTEQDIVVVGSQSESATIETNTDFAINAVGQTNGENEITYVWYRNGIETLLTTSEITINESTAGEYTYKCKISSDGCEDVYSEDIVVTVTAPIVVEPSVEPSIDPSSAPSTNKDIESDLPSFGFFIIIIVVFGGTVCVPIIKKLSKGSLRNAKKKRKR